MNNKGFGLPEVLVFMGVSLFALVVIAIFFRREFNNKLYDKRHDDIGIIESKSDSVYYLNLENKLKEAAYKYNSDKKHITLNELKEANLIDSLEDENGSSCDGYVTILNNDYYSYINCYGIYTTVGFDNNLVK